ncbi:MAG: diacylglycerol kinase [Flavobacteriales bacterium]|jgi:diacylglycerol kinase
MTTEKFSITKRLKSFGHAFNGLKTAFKGEHNLRIHLVAAILVVILGLYFKIEIVEWLILTLTIGFVIAMELLNSSIENLADYACKEQHPMIKKVKDIAAGAVLVSAISALIVGLLVFIPKLT